MLHVYILSVERERPFLPVSTLYSSIFLSSIVYFDEICFLQLPLLEWKTAIALRLIKPQAFSKPLVCCDGHISYSMLKMPRSFVKITHKTRGTGVLMETPTETALLLAAQAGTDGFRYFSVFKKTPSLSCFST